MSTRIIVADDHQILRQGIRALLERQPDFEVITDTSDGEQALMMIEQSKPDIAVIDVTMPGLDGIETTRQIVERTNTKVIALSMHTEPHFVCDMVRAGASAYLVKDDAFDELVRAIRDVLSNLNYYSPRIRAAAISCESRSIIPGTVSALSPREREVLQLLAEGQSTKEIAYRLKLSTKTIETHRRQIMQKLDLYSVAELTKCAIREGLTTAEPVALGPLPQRQFIPASHDGLAVDQRSC